ncbi:unnamed protein product [Strongylus vulgaris]|uniref:Uncharacterized protein n=1 Tax=Strongylus vulgaris TaxID=40348 RepID=A0A3P7LRG9_STRVU|nr:unnamed protein product [Strongylus vulgaris]
MRLKSTGSTSGFERLASPTSRQAVSSKSSRTNGYTPNTHPVQESTELRGHDNPAMDYGSTEMVTFGLTNDRQPAYVTRIAVQPDEI